MSEDRFLIDFSTRSTPAEPFAVPWIHGSESAKHNTDPDMQVYAYDQHSLVLRQNMAINYEGPFLFLLFGNDRAVLIDTGATADPKLFPLRDVVDEQITEWLATHPRESYGLVVIHTHAHGDHIAGDEQATTSQVTSSSAIGLTPLWSAPPVTAPGRTSASTWIPTVWPPSI